MITAAILLVFAFLLYANTLPFGYVYDDTIAISGNEITQQGLKGIPDILTTDFFTGYYGKDKNMVAGGRYRPLSLISFAIEYELFGENPHINHFFNIVFYALSGFFIWLVLVKLFPKQNKNTFSLSFPLVTALLFIVHPLHTEVVANIKGRDEIFALLFCLISFYHMINYLDSQKLKYLIYGSLFFFLGLLSKENAITWLAVMPLAFYFFRELPWKTIIKSMLPLLGFTLLFLILRQQTVGEGNQELINDLMNNPFAEMTLVQKYATILFTLAWYLKLFLFPHPLTIDYYPYHVPVVELASWQFIVPLVVFVLVFYILIRNWKKKNIYAFSIFYFIATISIVSNILFPVGVFMNERFAYMPSLAFCMIIAYFLFVDLQKKYGAKFQKIVLPLLTMALIIPAGIKTFARNQAWENSLILFTTDVKTSFDSAKSNAMAGEFLLIAAQDEKDSLLREQDYNLSIKYLHRAIDIYPKHGNALFNLAAAYYQYNQNFDSILSVYKRILRISPYETKVFKNLNIMFTKMPDADYKISAYRELDQLSPNNPEIYLRIGRLYLLDKKQPQLALEWLQKSSQLNSRNPETFNSLGVAEYQSGHINEALMAFETAEKLNPNDKQVVNNVYLLYNQLGNKQKLAEYARKLKQIQ